MDTRGGTAGQGGAAGRGKAGGAPCTCWSSFSFWSLYSASTKRYCRTNARSGTDSSRWASVCMTCVRAYMHIWVDADMHIHAQPRTHTHTDMPVESGLVPHASFGQRERDLLVLGIHLWVDAYVYLHLSIVARSHTRPAQAGAPPRGALVIGP
jgi:hypothetical protein